MKAKHLAFLGVALLIVIGCVTAAGCTTTQQTAADDTFIGAWTFPFNDGQISGQGIDVIAKDGTGFFVVLTEDGKRLLKYEPFTWKKTGDNTCLFTFTNDNKQRTQVYDSKTDTYTTEISKSVHKRLDPVTGIWFAEMKNDDGKSLKYTISLYPDGHAWMCISGEDATSQVIRKTWTKDADGKYTISKEGGEPKVWTLDSTQMKAKSTTGAEYTKKFADSGYFLSVLGPWYDAANNYLAVFNADGTGTVRLGDSVSRFTWTMQEFGSFKLHILDGENAGKDVNWTYDRTTDTFTTSKNTVYVRPAKSMDGVTISDSASAGSASDFEQVAGQWTAKCSVNGKTEDAILTVRNDGEGYWMVLGDARGIRVADVAKDTWKKTGENTYVTSSSSGSTYNSVYNPATDSLTMTNAQSGVKNTYTRLDPFIGIWSGTASAGLGSGKGTTIVKPDGTGIYNVAYDNGTVLSLVFTWKKNADGTYGLAYNEGVKRTYTVDASGKALVSDSGSTKTKAFLDSSFLISITGPWYCSDNDSFANFNADGTGFLNTQENIVPFTWKLTDIGKFEVTYTGGIFDNGDSAKGSVSLWTYDRDNNVFTSPHGEKHVRLMDSLDNRVTII